MPDQPRFEYMEHWEKPGESRKSSLNRLGREGWELVSVIHMERDMTYRFFFKRIILKSTSIEEKN